MVCGHQFRGKVYVESNIIWEAYTKEKQTIHDLSQRYKVSESTIKRLLKDIAVEWHNPKLGLVSNLSKHFQPIDC